MNHQGFVYRWTNIKTGMMYIGSHNGKNPKYIGSSPAFRKDYDQNPADWVREILYRGKDIRKVEKEFILKEGAVDSSSYYNDTTVTFASMEGKTHSVEARAAISEGHKGKKYGPLSPEHRAKLSEAAKGRSLSAEHRAKISEVQKGKIVSAEHRAAISEGLKRKKRGPYKKENQ